jgi:hypothetical protein
MSTTPPAVVRDGDADLPDWELVDEEVEEVKDGQKT